MYQVLILAIVAVAAAVPIAPEIHAPKPYSFGYTIKDKHGEQHREETGDGVGAVKGSYGFTDERGIHRQVHYVADKAGFRAEVKTNEHGTAPLNPAAVKMVSSAHPYLGGAGHIGAGKGVLGLGPLAAGPAPFMAGPVPFMAGPAPFMAGPAPLMAGPVPFMAGPEPFMAGLEPFMAGLEPLMAGPAPFMAAPGLLKEGLAVGYGGPLLEGAIEGHPY